MVSGGNNVNDGALPAEDVMVASKGQLGLEGPNTEDDGEQQQKIQGDDEGDDKEGEEEVDDDDGDDDDDEDEWDDDADPGYVTFPITEAEFYRLEEAAMKEAHREARRAALAAKFGMEYADEDGDADLEDKDLEMKEVEALLKHAPVPQSPQSPRVEVPVEVDLAGSLVAEADAPIWPKDAQAYAFSQAGDDEEYQSFIQGVEAASSDRDTSISMGLSDVPAIKSPGRGHPKGGDKHSLAGNSSSGEVSARIHEITTGHFGQPYGSLGSSGGLDSATSDVSDPDADSDDEGLAEALNSDGQRTGEVLECFHLKVCD